MEVTINQIIDLFKFCAEGHYAIVTYGYGDRWELPYKAKGEERRNYPIMWVTPLTHRINGVQIHRRYRLIVGDVVKRGEMNEQEVESDTEKWLMDIIAVLRNTHPLPIPVEIVTDNIEITPFTESSGDNLTGHYADITLKSDYKFNKCEAAGEWVTPPPPVFECAPANYIVRNVSGEVLATGQIPSGASKTITVPDGGDATWELRDTAGNLLSTGFIPAGGFGVITAPDATVENSDSSYVVNVASGGSLILPDVDILVVDINDNPLDTSTIPSVKNHIIDVVCNGGTVENSDSSYSDTVLSGGTLTLPDITVTDSDGSTFSQPSVTNVTCTLSPDADVENSDSSYSVQVAAGGLLTLPDQDIEVNGVLEGDIPSVGTIEIEVNDEDGNPLAADNVTITGRKVEIDVNTLDYDKTAFVMLVNTGILGETADNQFKLNFTGTYDVKTSDGQTLTNQTGVVTLTFPSVGNYLIEVKGNITVNYASSGTGITADRNKVLQVVNWGTFTITSPRFGGLNTQIIAKDAPILSSSSSVIFNGRIPIGEAINTWNVTPLTSFNSFFLNNTAFNQPLNSWNTSNVTDMRDMFASATVFNQNIGSWNTSSVTNMFHMFLFATSFNNGGNPSINNWNTSNVTTMQRAFLSATSFNQPIGNWNLSNVTITERMFRSATNFNQDIGNWDVSNVTNMSEMFNIATAFNQDISTWNVSSVTSFAEMFRSATAFNQNLGAWQLRTAGTILTGIFRDSGMNTANYTDTIVGWANYVFANSGTPANVDMATQTGRTFTNSRSGGANFVDAQAARAYLVSVGWTISGDTIV
jgi:surface protein